MLFLLRQIRRKLLTGNKVTTYLLYAIGEIILVVVGILIAVSIDDYNNLLQQRELETKYYRNLKKDLLADYAQLDTLATFVSNKSNAAKRIAIQAQHDSIGSLYALSDDFMTLLFVYEYLPNQNTYNEMISSGNLSVLQNEEIKSELMSLNQIYNTFKYGQDHVKHDYQKMINIFGKHVHFRRFYNMNASKIPHFVYDSAHVNQNRIILRSQASNLLSDLEYLNSIFNMEISYDYFLTIIYYTRVEVEGILKLIDLELEK